MAKKERGPKLGYFKNEQVASQEDVDLIVAWWRFHEERGLYKYLNWAVQNDVRLWREISRWEAQPFPRKPALDHVIFANRDHIRAERAASAKSRSELWWAVVAFSALTALLIGGTVSALEVL